MYGSHAAMEDCLRDMLYSQESVDPIIPYLLQTLLTLHSQDQLDPKSLVAADVASSVDQQRSERLHRAVLVRVAGRLVLRQQLVAKDLGLGLGQSIRHLAKASTPIAVTSSTGLANILPCVAGGSCIA